MANVFKKIDVDTIIKNKNPKLYKQLPRFVIKYIKKILHQDELNDIFTRIGNYTGLDFIEKGLKEINVKINVIGSENIPKQGRYIFVANHPLGGLDGVTFLLTVGRVNPNLKFIVNDVLMHIENLKELFVPVNKYGTNSKEYFKQIEDLYQSDTFILYFPAGMVSRKIKGKIQDLEWKKSFISKAIQYQRDIVPVHIEGQNSKFFYNLERFRIFFGIKANLGMFYLVDEMMKQRNKTITMRFGEAIPNYVFDKSIPFNEWAERVKTHVYALPQGERLPLQTKKIKVPKTLFKTKNLRTVKIKYKPIIAPIAKDVLENELTKDTFFRETNFGKNEIHIIDNETGPMVLQEIGRLREVTFREAGGGTGKDVDIDEYDTQKGGYKQLVVWDTEAKEIIGGYRFIIGSECGFYEDGTPKLATSELMNFSDAFIKNYLPYTIELGRSFIQPAYQYTSVASRKGLFSLDNLWDGLGGLSVKYEFIKYFFGKFTMYNDFNQKARDLILYYLQKHFKDNEKLAYPKKELPIKTDIAKLEQLFKADNPKDDYKTLFKLVREYKENIPPMVSAYTNLSPSMKVFGTALNKSFGYVEETGIMITVKDIYESKKARHIDSLNNQNTK